MACFKFPTMLCEKISSTISRFWRGEKERGNKIHWLRWESLSEAKEVGGLGFRDLKAFNIALVAKTFGRMMNEPNSMWAKSLSLPTSVLHHPWKQEGEPHPHGFGQVFSRDMNYLKMDLIGGWVMECPSIYGRISGSRMERFLALLQDLKILFLIRSMTCLLKVGGSGMRVNYKAFFSPAVCSIITSIPVSWTGSRDKLVWSHKASDIYLVSFGYQFAFDLIKNRGHPKPKSQTFSLDGWPKGK